MSQSGSQGSTDDGLWTVAIIAGIIAGIGVYFYFHMAGVNRFAGAYCYLLVFPFALLGNGIDWLYNLVGLKLNLHILEWLLQPAQNVLRFLDNYPFDAMNGEQREIITSIAGRYFFALTVVPLGFLFPMVKKWHPEDVYNKPHTLESLARRQSEYWKTSRNIRVRIPTSMPNIDPPKMRNEALVALDAIDTGSRLLTPLPTAPEPPIWASGLKPDEWLNLNRIYFDISDDSVPDKLAIEEELECQLKHPWRGWKDCPPIEKALIAAFASFYGYLRHEGESLLNDLGILFEAAAKRQTPADMNQAILDEEGLMKRIEKILNGMPCSQLMLKADNHAFRETAFMRMLNECRSTANDLMTELSAAMSGKKFTGRGVFPPALFVWLKECDRSLWYVLNGTGSNVPMVEAAGVFAHYKAEIQFGFPIQIPYVNQASRALIEDYLDMTPDRITKREIKRGRSKNMSDKLNELKNSE